MGAENREHGCQCSADHSLCGGSNFYSSLWFNQCCKYSHDSVLINKSFDSPVLWCYMAYELFGLKLFKRLLVTISGKSPRQWFGKERNPSNGPKKWGRPKLVCDLAHSVFLFLHIIVGQLGFCIFVISAATAYLPAILLSSFFFLSGVHLPDQRLLGATNHT